MQSEIYRCHTAAADSRGHTEGKQAAFFLNMMPNHRLDSDYNLERIDYSDAKWIIKPIYLAFILRYKNR